jgi:RNA polymerase sigma factor (sigma-70 family)
MSWAAERFLAGRCVYQYEALPMTQLPTTRFTLLARLGEPANQAAWEEFVAVYEPAVYGFARKKGLQDADARDLCQDVLRAVSLAIERWTPDPARGSFRAWMFRIARNMLINFVASGKRRVRGAGDSAVQQALAELPARKSGDSELYETEYRRQLFVWAAGEVQNEFAASTWQAFWRTAIEGREIKTVASELDMTTGAVYIARSRVIARLRERIEEFEQDRP